MTARIQAGGDDRRSGKGGRAVQLAHESRGHRGLVRNPTMSFEVPATAFLTTRIRRDALEGAAAKGDSTR